MKIETVKHTPYGELIVNGNTSVPQDPMNREYRQVLAWIAEGNTPEDMDPEPEPEPTRLEILEEALLSDGTVTATRLANAKGRLKTKLRNAQ